MLEFLMGRTKLRFIVGNSAIIGDRESQQDSYAYVALAATEEDTESSTAWVAALADGVGGGAAGDVASKLAVSRFLESIQDGYAQGISEATLLNAVYAGNQAIADEAQETPSYAGMATTLIGLVLDPDGMKWVSIGDSHLYIIRKSKITKLNEDHSMGAVIDKAYESGSISKQEADAAPYRNVILSCLSGEPIEMIDMHNESFRLKADDRIILASDGLDTLSRLEVMEIGRRGANPAACAKALTDAVLEKKKQHQDNTTVVVVDCRAK